MKKEYIPKSLDETYIPPKEEYKMSSYERLQSIFAEKDAQEGKLTSEGQEKLDFLLGIEKKPSIFSNTILNIKNILQKIDNSIFRKSPRIFNTTFYKRK